MNSSKRRRNKKTAAAGAILLAVMLAASACGGNNISNKGNNDQQGAVNEGIVVDELPDQSGIMEPEVSEPESTTDTDSPANSGMEEEPAVESHVVGEGQYIGLADSHSIEIETAAGTIPLQITEELASTIDRIPSDAKVKFEYIEKPVEGNEDMKQNWLVKIEELK